MTERDGWVEGPPVSITVPDAEEQLREGAIVFDATE